MGRVHRSILLRRERLKKYQADKRQRAMRPPSPPLPPEELEVKLEFGEIPGMDLDFESLPEINTADNNLSPEPAPEQWSPPVGLDDSQNTDLHLSTPQVALAPPPRSRFTRERRKNTNLPCLLCRTLTPNLPPFPESDLVQSSARVIFLLRQILTFPAVRCGYFVRSYGHPAEWVVLCEACAPMVAQASDLFAEMENLRAQYDPLRIALKNQILEDANEKFAYFQNDGEGSAIIRKIAKAVRSHVKINDKRAQDLKFLPRRKPKAKKKGVAQPKRQVQQWGGQRGQIEQCLGEREQMEQS
ncbi:uncharacterized protein LOC110854538 isoform X2 [Folsomia candida]|uniref:uncharacterized protein LOC110854538 isoform X2 n=1 Tax=Folsomia candida TaxID=158441 RepID=UPI000B8F59B6|nr:uncharacterized protein LOC110854538 isoform X2 [Folsomia candida]XP_035711173.1 uncharacterized protein LOC110854538 isoform X2 [Folsomia candida]